MKRTVGKIAALLALTLALSLQISAAAAGSEITYHGKRDGFEFWPGSTYTASDLFGNFKEVMPGDRLQETIEIKNSLRSGETIKLYMKVAACEEATATMEEFLRQLTMRIYQGDRLIYEASPDEGGALADNVLLGKLRPGEKLRIQAQLDVPLEMGNHYANRMGEVDWIFLAEVIDDDTLIQTGQLNWPIPVLGIAGLLLIRLGFRAMKRREYDGA